jgi:glycosyltransferase involved in cell wall biosynthesis
MKNKIVHLTSAHPRYDTRIFLKMCTSLAGKGYQVSFVVADGKLDEYKSGVNIFDVGPSIGGRMQRMTKTVKRVYQKAKELDADIYHLHDPELIPIGVKLKKLGKNVIFDAHEDLPKQLRSKPYLNTFGRTILPIIFEWYEKYTCCKFDAVIAATPCITDKFSSINPLSVNINNYPILGELANSTNWDDKNNEVCYLGGIAEIRGIKEVVKSLSFALNAKLNLAGRFSEASVEKEIKTWVEWGHVNELGFLGRKEVSEVLASSKAGLVTFHDVPNHVDAQPNKMFEYMSAGLPIITSNFPMWKEVVEGNHCGICIDPKSPSQIGEAINYILANPKEAKEMAENGIKAVNTKYNWSVEESKLFKLYQGLLS